MPSERSCERCDKPAEFYLRTAYESSMDAIHPLIHRYPAAMFGACAEHVADLLSVGPTGLTDEERLAIDQWCDQQQTEYEARLRRGMERLGDAPMAGFDLTLREGK